MFIIHKVLEILNRKNSPGGRVIIVEPSMAKANERMDEVNRIMQNKVLQATYNRFPNEPTHIFLARVLDNIGLSGMAQLALDFHYDDFRCPKDVERYALNRQRLIEDLKYEQRNTPSFFKAQQIQYVIRDTQKGVFNATEEEAHEYAETPEGQEILRKLLYGLEGE